MKVKKPSFIESAQLGRIQQSEVLGGSGEDPTLSEYFDANLHKVQLSNDTGLPSEDEQPSGQTQSPSTQSSESPSELSDPNSPQSTTTLTTSMNGNEGGVDMPTPILFGTPIESPDTSPVDIIPADYNPESPDEFIVFFDVSTEEVPEQGLPIETDAQQNCVAPEGALIVTNMEQLRDAIETANSMADNETSDDIVIFIGDNTIQWDMGLDESDENADLDLWLGENDTLTILGCGCDRSVLDASSQSQSEEQEVENGVFQGNRHFELHSGTLILDKVQLTGGDVSNVLMEGYPQDGQDGAYDSVAQSGWGGAIRTESGTQLIVNDSCLNDNDAVEGGAIYANGQVMIHDTSIMDNSARVEGAGLYIGVQDANMDNLITGSVISNNTVSSYDEGAQGYEQQVLGGGGISLGGARLSVTETLISENVGPMGGGILAYNKAQLSLDEVTLSMNSSQLGGGIYVQGSTLEQLNASSLLDNTSEYGGGLYLVDASATLIAQSTIGRNTASMDGGGIYIGDGAQIQRLTNSTISSNQAGGVDSAGRGGGIFIQSRESDTLVDFDLDGGNDGILTGGGDDGFFTPGAFAAFSVVDPDAIDDVGGGGSSGGGTIDFDDFGGGGFGGDTLGFDDFSFGGGLTFDFLDGFSENDDFFVPGGDPFSLGDFSLGFDDLGGGFQINDDLTNFLTGIDGPISSFIYPQDVLLTDDLIPNFGPDAPIQFMDHTTITQNIAGNEQTKGGSGIWIGDLDNGGFSRLDGQGMVTANVITSNSPSIISLNNIIAENFLDDDVQSAAGANSAFVSLGGSIYGSLTGTANLYYVVDGGLDPESLITGSPNYDRVGTDDAPVDPGLDDALQDNGGPTLTHALEDDAIALDFAIFSSATQDQRGLDRFQDGNGNGATGSDPGAYEAPQVENILVVAPIVIDLDGDGVELIAASQSNVSAIIGHENYNLGWVSGDDALLMYDANSDGLYSGIEEIELSGYHELAKTDLEGLILAFDSNQDGFFNANDDAYDAFGVWQDKNENGLTEEGEYQTLAEAKLTQITLTSSDVLTMSEGNVIYGLGELELDGQTHTFGDVGLGTSLSYQYSLQVGQSTALDVITLMATHEALS